MNVGTRAVDQKRKFPESEDEDQLQTLQDLLTDGLPRIRFEKDTSRSSRHYSDHAAIISEHTPVIFGMLDDLNSVCTSRRGRHSMILDKIHTEISSHVFRYSNEAEIQELVKTLFDDIRFVSALQKRLKLKPETSLAKVRYLGKEGSNKSDFWLVLTDSGRPVMVIEVKSPQTPGVLDDLKVKGQIFDYMMDVMSFFGQVHIIGITTTFEEFKLHWFPHSDEYMSSTSLLSSTDRICTPDMGKIAEARALHSTGTILHTDKNLVPMLVSAFHKTILSPYAAVSLLDDQRAYLNIRRDGWQWQRGVGPSHKLTLRMTPAIALSTSFTIVKYFIREVKKKVWLSVAQPLQQIVVLKVCSSAAEAEKERDIWHTVNNASAAFCTTLRSMPVLVVPMVIHAHEDKDTKRVGFNFNLETWSSQVGATGGTLPSQLSALSAAMAAQGSALDPRAVAREAIQKTAIAGVMHTDLAWRHVALMPVINTDGTLSELIPILIDFGRVELGVEPALAMHRMGQTLEAMIETTVW